LVPTRKNFNGGENYNKMSLKCTKNTKQIECVIGRREKSKERLAYNFSSTRDHFGFGKDTLYESRSLDNRPYADITGYKIGINASSWEKRTYPGGEIDKYTKKAIQLIYLALNGEEKTGMKIEGVRIK
jgi:hypothetical protein